MSRYKENTVVPVIGFFTTASKEGFRQFHCLSTVAIELAFHPITPEDVKFVILPVRVEKEHDVPLSSDENVTAKGYTGGTDLPDLDCFGFHNQHPYASYGYGHVSRDHMWRMVPRMDKVGVVDWLAYYKDNNLPWRYTQLTTVLDSLYHMSLDKDDTVGKLLLDKILTTIAVSFPEWEVKHDVHKLDDFIWKEYKIVV